MDMLHMEIKNMGVVIYELKYVTQSQGLAQENGIPYIELP